MLKALLFLSCFTLTAMVTAQNLVPNASFEDTALCDVYDPIRTPAPPWFNPNLATPDIYDNDLERQCGVPWDPANPDVQLSGWQYARTGTRFAGAYHWDGPLGTDVKEYLMAPLQSTLLAGQAYEVSLYYSRMDGFYYATDRISVYFAPDSVHYNNGSSMPVEPQVDLRDPNSTYLAEAVQWVHLVDTFVAVGNERYLVIGSFLDSSQVIAQQVSGSFHLAYYFYDDVEVRALDISVGYASLNVYMCGGMLCWNSLHGAQVAQLTLCDVSGRLLRQYHPEPDSWGAIPLPTDLMQGIYLVTVESPGAREVKKIWLEGQGP